MRPFSRSARRALLAAAALGSAAALGAGAASAAPGDGEVSLMAQVSPATEEAAQGVAARTGLELSRWIPEIGWAEYTSDDPFRDAHADLRGDPSVVRLDWARAGEDLQPMLIPQDVQWTQQGTVSLPTGGQAPWNWHWVKANFPAAWDVTRSNSGIAISVIDSGFDTENDDLKTKLRQGKNFQSSSAAYLTADVRAIRVDEGHGSHVAGLVAAASGNNLGVTGGCYDCTVIPYKINTFSSVGTGDANFIADLAQALVATADDGSVAVNMSLGTRVDHAPIRDAVALVRSRGKVVVAAAGNDQQQFPGVPHYPAAYPGVFAVANTTPTDGINPTSSNGDYVDIAAPGTGILSTWDTRLVPGQVPQEFASTHGVGFTNLSGTSMASPIVASLVGLVKSVRPDLTPDEVEAVIQGTAFDLGAQGKDQVFGAGRIDARKALDAAIAYVRPTPPPPPAAQSTPPPAPKVRTTVFLAAKFGDRTLKLNKLQTVPVGASIVIAGRTKPAVRNTQLVVQRRSTARGTKWKVIRTVKTNGRGRYGFTYTPKTRGKHTLRIVLRGTSTLQRIVSPQIRLEAVRSR